MFVSFTMPVRKQPYISKRLFPFFDGLIPEGWLLNIASESWKINQLIINTLLFYQSIEFNLSII
ncbi:HipA N-terminal domain-containing protein [Sediminibacterium sp. TEGAF015]|uniref:HipA N-terminal domain-containing protein n=1 Tax=Sediminibacterium sp. TEGAF015 TaxID=575378 RepID=UPI002232A0F4|nr:HipA N-terminal domain-containing protein [Sediminibacterium sp. TEGAF015]